MLLEEYDIAATAGEGAELERALSLALVEYSLKVNRLC